MPPTDPDGPESPAPTEPGPAALWAGATAAGVTAVAWVGQAAPVAAFAAGALGGVAAFLLGRRSKAAAAHPAPAAAASPTLEPMLFPALEALPDPLMLVAGRASGDAAGRRILFANAAARALLRIPREDALLVAGLRRPEVLEAVDQSLFPGVASETAFDTGGATDRSWRIHAVPLAPAPDGSRLALVVMHDETDARRGERMRADFLANASHELRTPLASIAGFVETLRGHAKDDAGARERFLGIVAEQAARMGRLIDDLMSLSRVELNEHIPPSGLCDLSFAVAEVADTLAPLAQDKGVTLDLRLAKPDEAAIVGDRDQILQVVQNLLANAVKYAPPGSRVSATVAARATLEQAQAADPDSPRRAAEAAGRLPLLAPDRADGERYAVLTVTDEGPGMRRETLPRLSERFYRVEGQKSGDRQGTGLGLAIVKHIVNRHRGGLIVESAPGLGAEFRAYFPMPKG